ncbi:hypothetical protein B1T45_08390 [Mycobacterium kansasii]|jgi:transposase-like protein|uniref:Transposase n=2 Tax=Mycobacteriaceae TaxID=1762 RepID=A0ABY6RHG7_9MYCO|nr:MULTISPECIES: hypothetical protein [Mycobacteriaceae]ARG61312.1 hypothetical protein B1T45_08390 [Mycobacterium kansasii]ASL23331.1 transposase IS3/IS911 family protein [Mycobacterium intracellulare subsp. chimaera]VAZ74830.1 hypothetical protein LAUMK15_02488 [Mycobacterium persicum]GLC03856.1 hypothetical protein SRL2020400_44470 [Mycobacterium kiyosense]AGM31409.1 transposase [Mycobacteroides abscessus subsp. bolletii 50594]
MVAQPVAEIGRELNVHEHLLRKWVAAEWLRDGAATDAHRFHRMVTDRGRACRVGTRLRAGIAEK